MATWLLATAAFLLTQAAVAASLQVSPISLEFSPEEQAQGIWLSNTGTVPLRAQVRVQQWSQTDGSDQLAPARDMTASPPMLEIAAGARQLVRIIRLQSTAPAQELSYRLLVDELPDESRQQEDSGLQFLLRYSVPVFVLPQGSEATNAGGKSIPLTDTSTLSAVLHQDRKEPSLAVSNQGRQRVRISQLIHVAANGTRTPLVPGLLGYVLAGQNMQWPLELPASLGGNGVLKAKFNNDVEEQSLPLVTAVR